LKIDRSFIADMLVNPSHAAIVRSIVDLGHNLELRVVGEGVETADVLTALTLVHCDLAQGYLIARPMPAGQLMASDQLVRQADPEPAAGEHWGQRDFESFG
jgi:EAL domain-containing protein (putative c-di-GMP-specific phosphodiesterase class I)